MSVKDAHVNTHESVETANRKAQMSTVAQAVATATTAADSGAGVPVSVHESRAFLASLENAHVQNKNVVDTVGHATNNNVPTVVSSGTEVPLSASEVVHNAAHNNDKKVAVDTNKLAALMTQKTVAADSGTTVPVSAFESSANKVVNDNVATTVGANVSTNIGANVSTNIGTNVSANVDTNGANVNTNTNANANVDTNTNIGANVDANVDANVGGNADDNADNNASANANGAKFIDVETVNAERDTLVNNANTDTNAGTNAAANVNKYDNANANVNTNTSASANTNGAGQSTESGVGLAFANDNAVIGESVNADIDIDQNGNDDAVTRAENAETKSAQFIDKTEKAQPAYARLENEALIRQLTERMHYAIRNGAHEVRMILRPETLGEVKMNIRVQGDIVMARMIVENRQVKSLVESNLQSLKDELAKNNLHLEAVQVDVGTEDDKTPHQTWREMAEASNQAGLRNRFREGLTTEDGAEDANDDAIALGVETGKRYGNNTFEYFV